MNKIKILAGIALAVLSFGARADLILVGAYEGVNDGYYGDGTSMLCDIISGDSLTACDATELGELGRVDWDYTAELDVDGNPVGPLTNPQTTGNLTVTGTVFKESPDLTEATAGTWSYEGTGTVSFVVFKFDNILEVWETTDGTTSGTWESTYLNNSGNDVYALSHATTYSAVVPVPAAAWLFASGLLGLVGVARRKA